MREEYVDRALELEWFNFVFRRHVKIFLTKNNSDSTRNQRIPIEVKYYKSEKPSEQHITINHQIDSAKQRTV